MERSDFLQKLPAIGQLSLLSPNAEGKLVIGGGDEVGRGPWAGPVVAAIVILPEKHGIRGLKDSKLLSAQKRQKLFTKITQKAAFGIGIATHTEVDTHGLIKATNFAFNRATAALPFKPDLLLIDGRDAFKLPVPFYSIIKGDRKHKCISAASILAKVTRDCLMHAIGTAYPVYGFESHKGYGTREHQRAIKKYGLTQWHRRSFAPIKESLMRATT